MALAWVQQPTMSHIKIRYFLAMKASASGTRRTRALVGVAVGVRSRPHINPEIA
jgi:hypothetical protein